MQTPIDFGKDFLNRLFDQRDADACKAMLAGDLVWITPESMHHFLSEGAVLKFLRKQIAAAEEARYVDLVSIKSSPSADNIMTVAYEINLISREDERPLYLRCSMAICRRSKRLEITFLHFSKKSERDSTEQIRDFVTNLPCGVMILACLDGRREEAIYYNDYFAHRLRYRQEEFAKAIRRNPFFMTSEEDRDRIHEEIARARKNGGSIAANMRFYRRDGNSFYYRMKGAPAYQANGGTVFYCVFQETTGFQLNADRLQERLDSATEIVRQIPEGICGIEYMPGSRTLRTLSGAKAPDPDTDPGTEGQKGADARAVSQAPGKDRGKTVPAPAGEKKAEKVTDATRPRALSEKTGSAEDSGEAGNARVYRENKNARKRPEKDARVIFTSRNIPSLFGISNSAYTRNILEDPFYGLEMTSITRERILSSYLFNPEKTNTGKPVSCGIFRLQKPEGKSLRVELVTRRVQEKDGTMRLYLFYYDREEQQQDLEKRIDRAMKMGRAGQDQLRKDLQKAKEGSARKQNELKSELKAAQEKHSRELARIEDQLLEEKNRCVLMSRQLEDARATQKQMAEELQKSEADASRRIRNYQAGADRKVEEARAAAGKAREQADQKVREARTAAEQETQRARQARQEAEEMIRGAKAAAEEEIGRARREAGEMVRGAREAAEKEVRRASDGRSLLEEQLREAQDRNRILEAQLKSEKARRRLLEEQIRNGGKPIPELLREDAERKKDDPAGLAGMAGTIAAIGTVAGAVSLAGGAGARAGADSPAGGTGTRSGGDSPAGRAGTTAEAMPPAGGTGTANAAPYTGQKESREYRRPEPQRQESRPGDWMTLEQPLTVFSSIDPEQYNNEDREITSKSSLTAGGKDLTPGKEFTSQAVFRPGKKAGYPGNGAGFAADESGYPEGAAGAAADTSGYPESTAGPAADKSGHPESTAGPAADKSGHPKGAAGPAEDKNGFVNNTEKTMQSCGPVLRESFSGERNSAGKLTPEEESGYAEKRLRAREYDRAKGRLTSLMEKADVFLRSREQEKQEKSIGEKKTGPGFSVSCSRENIAGLMNDFLEAASPLEQLLRENSFSPEECLRNVLIYEGIECGKKGITLRACRDSRLPETVEGFGGILQRALCELLEQAISRTHEGGTITVHSRADRPSGGFVNIYFRIDDNGEKISEKEMQTLFESRTSGGTDSPFRSGLFSAREAATLMGGSIHARSGSSGSRFTMAVTLRVHEPG